MSVQVSELKKTTKTNKQKKHNIEGQKKVDTRD